MMNAASVLLSPRCEYTRFLYVRIFRTAEKMGICGFAQSNIMLETEGTTDLISSCILLNF